MSERRRDYMVSKRVHFFYMLTWINSLLLVAAFAALVWTLLKTPAQVQQVPLLFGVINPFLLLGLLAFVIVCTSLTLGVYTIIHTHHLMGSAYAIGRVLRELNERKFDSRVRLRDGDFFIEIGDEINRIAETMGAYSSSGPVAKAPETPAAEPKAEAPKVDAEPPSAPAEEKAEGASTEATPSEAS